MFGRDDPLWVFEVKKRGGEFIAPAPAVGLYFEAESLTRISGKAIEEKRALNDWALHGEPKTSDKPNDILNAGPYVTLPSGSYRLMVKMKIDNQAAAGDLVKVDIAALEGRSIIVEKTFRAEDFSEADRYSWFEVPFDLESGPPWQVEFRTYLVGKVKVDIDAFYVLPFQERDPRHSFEAEELFYYSGRRVAMEDASGGAVIRSSGQDNPADLMVHGPKRFYEAGSYEATVRFKTEGQNPLFTVTVEAIRNTEMTVVSEKTVSSGGEGWREVTLPFTLDQQNIIDIKVVFGGK